MPNPRRNPWPWVTGEHKLDCSHPTEHAEDHVPHKDTGRPVCLVCHAPYYVLAERARVAQEETTDGP